MKKFLLFFVATLLATVARAADGDTFAFEGLNYKVLSETDKTVEVTDNKRSVSGDIVIPSFVTLNDTRYSVTSICENAFESCYNMNSVTIPESVTSIGNGAFKYCDFLTSVTIPNSVTSIGNETFYSCSHLASVSIPESVTYIGDYAFSGCGRLTSLTIPESVTEIGESAFSSCGLTSITIPESLTAISNEAFAYCSMLTSVAIPNSVTVIGSRAFRSCYNLTSVTIPESVTSIGASAFSGCKYMTSITLPNSETSIGEEAFYECISLTSVTIPELVTEIGDGAFGFCTSLTEFIVDKSNKNYCSYEGALYNTDNTTIVLCPAGKTEYNFPKSVTSIGNGAFYGCTNLTSATIPESVTEIGNSAFYYCDNLTSVTISNSVTSIGKSAFSYCKSLTSVSIPESVTSIGTSAFSGCSNLASVSIPNSLTEISGGIFQSCKSLILVTIPKSVTEIGTSAFSSCSNLTTIIDLNPTPQTVGRRAFSSVPADAVIYIPKGSIALYKAAEGWSQFTDFREMGDFDVTLSASTLELAAGQTAQITPSITKDKDVTTGEATWSSSNPEVATVDDGGKVTAVGDGTAMISYTVYDGYGLAHTASCTVTVKGSSSGIDDVVGDDAATTVDAYSLRGVTVLRNADAAELDKLPAGLYIVRQGNTVKKIVVK